MRMLVGHCTFASRRRGAAGFAPASIRPCARRQRRLATLVQLVSEETRADRPGREVVLARLLEVLLIEALRSTTGPTAPPGLLRGLADERLAAALRRMHERPTVPGRWRTWRGRRRLSRSAFFERFRREVGVAPMEYLLAWRMALAKDLLASRGSRRGGGGRARGLRVCQHLQHRLHSSCRQTANPLRPRAARPTRSPSPLNV